MFCACGNNKCGIRQYLPPKPYFPPSPTPPCSKTDVGKCLCENPQIFVIDTESEIRRLTKGLSVRVATLQREGRFGGRVPASQAAGKYDGLHEGDVFAG